MEGVPTKKEYRLQGNFICDKRSNSLTRGRLSIVFFPLLFLFTYGVENSINRYYCALLLYLSVVASLPIHICMQQTVSINITVTSYSIYLWLLIVPFLVLTFAFFYILSTFLNISLPAFLSRLVKNCFKLL